MPRPFASHWSACSLLLAALLAACGGGGGGTGPSGPTPDDYVPRSPFEGYGNATPGGEGGEVFQVTTLRDGGPGSLREGVVERSSRPRRIVFDVGGTITLTDDLIIRAPFLTIDGSTAPAPGITIQQGSFTASFIVAGTHDVILKDLRVQGLFVDGGGTGGNNPTLIIDGDSQPDQVARRIVFDHITVTKAGDSGPDIWDDVSDLTIQFCFFYANLHPTTVSGAPGDGSLRQRISMHHNVYAANGERHPQLRGDVRTFDYVNNIVYGWGATPLANDNFGYGMRIRNEPGERRVEGVNVVNNAFVPIPDKFTAWALVYGDQPGSDVDEGPRPEAVPAQGSVVTSSRMGRLWVAGNLLPVANRDHYSTVAAPIPVATAARITTYPATELAARLLPAAGVRYRSAREQALIDEIAGRLGARSSAARFGTGP